MKKIIFGMFFILSTVFAFAATGEGTGEGYTDTIKVLVNTENGKITNIQIEESNETKRIAEPAMKKLTQEILSKQTVEVDNIAGATYTSLGFKDAVRNALNNSK